MPAESFAKTLQPEHEKIIKKLMKDPDYQKSFMQIMQLSANFESSKMVFQNSAPFLEVRVFSIVPLMAF
jgi:hypothetical protein